MTQIHKLMDCLHKTRDSVAYLDFARNVTGKDDAEELKI